MGSSVANTRRISGSSGTLLFYGRHVSPLNRRHCRAVCPGVLPHEPDSAFQGTYNNQYSGVFRAFPTEEHCTQTEKSPLKMQTRVVTCFPSGDGYALGSVEGRAAMQYVASLLYAILLLIVVCVQLCRRFEVSVSRPRFLCFIICLTLLDYQAELHIQVSSNREEDELEERKRRLCCERYQIPSSRRDVLYSRL